MDQNRQRDRRWIILGEDGRFITLGRTVPPTEEETAEAEVAMRAQGLAGWIAAMVGNPWTIVRPDLVQERPLAGPTATFVAAVAAFRRRRQGDFDQGN